MKKKLPLKLLDSCLILITNPRQLPLVLCFLVNASFAQVHLVKDINSLPYISGNEFQNLTDVNGSLYFTSNNKELWKTDGTAVGTIRIKKFKSISALKYVSAKLFIVANDSLNGNELWTSDGTPSGTVLVKDITSGANGSDPSSFVDVNGTAYFIASDGKKGRELWKTDGTSSGTVLVKDVMKGSGSCNCRDMISFNNSLFFVANNGSNGYEIWQSDGSAAGTYVFKDIRAGKLSSSPNSLTVSNGIFYFMADDDINGQELWKSDGTELGTTLVKDIRPGLTSSFPSNFIDVNGTLYFRANDGVHGFELWKSDGTAEGTSMVIDIVAGKNNGYTWINGTANVNGTFYFILGRTVYRTNGTAQGTVKVFETDDFYERKELAVVNNDLYVVDNSYTDRDIYKISASGVLFVTKAGHNEQGYPLLTYITKVGNGIYFAGNNNVEQAPAIVRSDGTPNGTAVVFGLNSITSDSNPVELTNVNGELFFGAINAQGYQGIWKSDGSETGTSLIKDFVQIYELKEYNSMLIGSVNNSYRSQLWKSDGTEGGTTMLHDFGYDSNHPTELTSFQGQLYFSALTQQNGVELWKTDGTLTGTALVKDINVTGPHNPGSFPAYFTPAGNNLFFIADDGIHGVELWKSDGTESGTSMVKDITPGIDRSVFFGYTNFKDVLYFIKQDDSNGHSTLWKTDGTSAGTIVVPDIAPLKVLEMKVMNNALYFVGYNTSIPNNNALWKMDSVGVVTKVHDIYATDEIISFLSAMDDKLYLTVNNYRSTNLFELWVSDGTTSGTMKAADLNITTYPGNPAILNHVLYFTDISNQPVLFRSDGTACGTYRITTEGYPFNLATSGTKLYFSMNSATYGRELFAIDQSDDESPCPLLAKQNFSDESEYTGISMTQFPNPFTTNFTLRVSGVESDPVYQASIIHINGAQIENHTDLKRNTDYTIGADLNNGLYLLRVIVDGKVITKRISKFH
ncbi:MAG TPA: ELWxxDGT repeat protein [Cyclobacteriaceae bacterium]